MEDAATISEELPEKKESTVKMILSWMFSNVKFLLMPGYRSNDLLAREREFEKNRSKRIFIRRLNAPLTIFGLAIVLVVVSFAVFAPWISTYTFKELNGIFSPMWGAPSPDHPLGTGYFGRDILGRMIWGARSSLVIALPALGIAVSVGVVTGMIAGYYGGWVDSILMRFADIMLAFPYLVLALVVVAIFGANMVNILFTFGILGIPGYARLVRGSVLQAKEFAYVEAAKVSGASNWRIMFRHLLPNCISPVIIAFTFDIGGMILSLAGLAFIGVYDPTLVAWGNDVAVGEIYLYQAPWAALWPGFMIAITVLGFMLVGDGLRDALDPKLRAL